MSYERKEHAGGAVNTTLTSTITSGDTTMSVDAATGWPDGSTGPFYIVIGVDLGTEEKVLVTSRSGTSLLGVSRGEDGTAASAHSSGETVAHVFTATEADEANVLVAQTLGTVTTKGDQIVATGNGTLGRLAAGANGLPQVADSAQTTGMKFAALTSTGIGTDAVGSAQIAADAVGTAEIAASAVGNAELAADAVTTVKISDVTVTAAKLATDAVTTTKIADANVTIAKFASGLQPVQVCTSGTRPGTPSVGMVIYETDTGKTLHYHSATVGWGPPWNSHWGIEGRIVTVTSPQGSITSAVNVTSASLSLVAVANRIYEHSVTALVSNTTAGGHCALTIADASNVEIHHAARHVVTGGDFETLSWTFREVGLSAGTVTRKLRANSTSGLMGIQSDTAALQYSIKDVGSNGVPTP